MFSDSILLFARFCKQQHVISDYHHQMVLFRPNMPWLSHPFTPTDAEAEPIGVVSLLLGPKKKTKQHMVCVSVYLVTASVCISEKEKD